MTLNEFLGGIDIGYVPFGDGLAIWDKQGVWNLETDTGGNIYYSVYDIIDRVAAIWYDWIYEDLVNEFDCEEDFHDNLEEMRQWIELHKDDIYPEDYEHYMDVIDIIQDPGQLAFDTPF